MSSNLFRSPLCQNKGMGKIILEKACQLNFQTLVIDVWAIFSAVNCHKWKKMVRAESWHYGKYNLSWSYCCQIKDSDNIRLEIAIKLNFQTLAIDVWAIFSAVYHHK